MTRGYDMVFSCWVSESVRGCVLGRSECLSCEILDVVRERAYLKRNWTVLIGVFGSILSTGKICRI